MKIFKDRQSAGKLLAQHLKQYKEKKNTVVLGIPRGGVVVAAEVAKELNLPLDILVTRKIGAPNQQELALGAVDADGEVIWEEQLLSDLGLAIDDLEEEIRKEVEEVKRREKIYRQNKSPLNVVGKTIILVDDGIATGATILAAINYLKRHQAKEVILAVPVASKESINRIVRELGEFGEVIVLETPENFAAVGQFYQSFLPVSDQEVVEYLQNKDHARTSV